MFMVTRPTSNTSASGGICAGSNEPIRLQDPPEGLAPYETQMFRGSAVPALEWSLEWKDATGSHWHPGNAALIGIRAAKNWDRPKAEEMARLILEHDPDLWLRYNFALTLGPVELQPGWVSGMDQGQALALFSLLGDREHADTLFETLHPGSPVIWTDSQDYWIEEYPADPPDHVINGHIFGLFGLWEYWRLTGSEEAETLLIRGIETTRRWMPVFLGDRIEYDTARTGRGILGSYYQLYIEQFSVLAGITGEACFDQAARFVAAHP